MNANEREWYPEDRLAEVVVGAAFEVADVRGAGFLEKVYPRALFQELSPWGVQVRTGMETQPMRRTEFPDRWHPPRWAGSSPQECGGIQYLPYGAQTIP
ncbi:MAG: hypothetical protein HY822_04280 [Acidobacteria bacterium]|nr:hypothetical protein [Acidobacteriota bacterium]